MFNKNPRIAAAEKDLGEAIRLQRQTGNNLLYLCCSRDTYRQDLLRRKPSWIEDEAGWEEYKHQRREKLRMTESMIAFHESTLTKGAEAIDGIEKRIAALEKLP